MDNNVSMTALMSAFAIAYQNEFKNPVLRDGYVRRLISDEEYGGIKSYIKSGADALFPGKSFSSDEERISFAVNTQFAPTPASRAAYCDESVRAAIRTGTKQYVILGAGLDTFTFRNPDLMKKIRVFEVDHPKTQEDKLIRLKNAGLDIS